MTRVLRTALTISLAATAVASAQRPCTATSADQAVVRRTVEALFDSVRRDDLPLWRQSVTADFYAFDNGKRFDGEALLKIIEDHKKQGHTFVWNPGDFKIDIDCRLAWFTEIDTGSIDGKPTVWLESGALKKTGEDWRLSFIESQRQLSQ